MGGRLRIAFGRGTCGSLAEASSREWLVTDGLGGYASGTVAGLRTRRYHGLLTAATAPGGSSRSLGLAALDAVVVIGDTRIRLATHEWVGGTVDPRGHELLAGFDLDDGIPRWRYDLGAVQLEVEIAMDHGHSRVAVVHRMLAGRARVEVTPLCTWRDQHGERLAGADPDVVPTASGFLFESAYRVDGPGFEPRGSWYRGAFHREEAARGLGATEDLWAAGTFRADLSTGEALTVTASTDLEGLPVDGVAVVASSALAPRTWRPWPGPRDDVDRILAVAADRFYSSRPPPGLGRGRPPVVRRVVPGTVHVLRRALPPVCRTELATSLGLRSLSPRDPAHRTRHRGGPAERDAAHHQGTVWPWLIGPYVDALSPGGCRHDRGARRPRTSSGRVRPRVGVGDRRR
jgi:glycogen debranching enzyme